MKLIEFGRKDIGDGELLGKNARFFDPEPHHIDDEK